MLVHNVGEVFAGVSLKLLEKDTVAGDLTERLPVRAARHAEAHGARRTVPREANDPHVVAKVLTPELSADACTQNTTSVKLPIQGE